MTVWVVVSHDRAYVTSGMWLHRVNISYCTSHLLQQRCSFFFVQVCFCIHSQLIRKVTQGCLYEKLFNLRGVYLNYWRTHWNSGLICVVWFRSLTKHELCTPFLWLLFLRCSSTHDKTFPLLTKRHIAKIRGVGEGVRWLGDLVFIFLLHRSLPER